MEVIYIFDWLGDFIGGIGSAIGEVFDFLGEQISNAIWNTMIQWLYETIYNAVADFFTMMGNMGADVFDLEWVQATINLFTLLAGHCSSQERSLPYLMWLLNIRTAEQISKQQQ